jgi:hypothetical protein
MNKKAALSDPIVMVVTFLSIAIIIGLALLCFNTIAPVMQSTAAKIDTTGRLNASVAIMVSDITIAYSNFNWFAMINIAAIIILYFITNAFIKANPIFLFPYVCGVALAVWFSAYVANQYETWLGMAMFSGLSAVPSLNSFILNLPIYSTIIGFIGAILLFIRIDFQNA